MSDHTHPTTFWLYEGEHDCGLYDSAKKYSIDDIVQYNNTPFICIQDVSGLDPTTEHWKPLNPIDYITTKWCPKSYPSGSYVSYKNKIYVCSEETTTELPDEYWTVTESTFRGQWSPLKYRLDDVVMFNNHYYKCKKTSYNEKPTNYAHWELVDRPDNWVPNWASQQYNIHDIVSYNNKLYICTEPATTEIPDSSESWNLLPIGSTWGGIWKRRVYEPNTVVQHDGVIYVAIQEATNQSLMDKSTWTALHHINWRNTWICQNYQAGDFVLYDRRMYLCTKDTVDRTHPTNTQFWYLFCGGGVRFPSWISSSRSIEINIPFDQELTYSPVSGGFFWKISPPKLAGSQSVAFNTIPIKTQKQLQPWLKDTITEIFMLVEWHVGEYIDNGQVLHFYAGVFERYYETENALIPILINLSGKPGFQFYVQWRASNLPYITQPKYFDMMVLLNRRPHETITEFFRQSAHHIQIYNRMRTDEGAFEDEMRDVISNEGYIAFEKRRKEESSDKGILFEPLTYEEFREKKLSEWINAVESTRNSHKELSEIHFKNAEEQIKLWKKKHIERLKTLTREISSQITTQVKMHIGFDKWNNLNAAECKKVYPYINWSIKGGNIRLSDVEKQRIELEQRWEIYEKSPAYLKMIELDQIEATIKQIMDLFPDKKKRRNHGKKKKK